MHERNKNEMQGVQTVSNGV